MERAYETPIEAQIADGYRVGTSRACMAQPDPANVGQSPGLSDLEWTADISSRSDRARPGRHRPPKATYVDIAR
jgi:hypothetical protein